MYTCPHCGKKALTAWRKAFMGIYGSVKCLSCGHKVGIPKSAFWLQWPLWIGLVFVIAWPTASGKLLGLLFGSAGMFVLWLRKAPIVSKEN